MGVWTDRVLPHIVDRACSVPEIAALRREALAGLHGKVLDVGFGSGTNLPLLPATVTDVVAVEPSDEAWRMSSVRRTRSAAPVVRGDLDGEHLVEPDDSCDSAVVTFALCTIPDPVQALRELRRVLRPGGALHFLEHGLAPEPAVRRWQHRIDPFQKRLCGGCHLSRDIPALLHEAGFEVTTLRTEYLPGPGIAKPWTHGYLGVAVPA